MRADTPLGDRTTRKKAISAKNSSSTDVQKLLSVVEVSLEDDQAIDILSIDLKNKSTLADHMVVASGRSTRHVGAIADHLVRKLKEKGVKGISMEGQTHCDWVLIDAGDIIVHLFRPEVRDFYKLEKLWSDEAALRPDGVQQAAS